MTTATKSATAAVAKQLVALCREGKNMEAIEKLYGKDVVSVEPMGNEQMPAEMKGIEAVKGKNRWWAENNEVHSVQIDGPFVGDNQFAVHGTYETTFKPSGQRGTMTEMGLYTVKDGKIVREQFFYHMPS